MKAVVALCVFCVSLVSSAPALNDGVVPQVSEASMLNTQPRVLREKRSQYPQAGYGGGYASPCGGVQLPIAPLPLPAPSPYLQPAHAAGYGQGYGHGYAAPHSYGYPAPHYRADEMGDEQETFFPDMENMMTEHMPMARYGGYGAAPVAPAGLAGVGQLAPSVGGGPAIGVFPNAHVGGCSVPLLLSCSPSVVPGRLAKSGYGGGYAAAAPNAYREVDMGHQGSHEEDLHVEHEAAHDQMTSVSEASHAKHQ